MGSSPVAKFLSALLLALLAATTRLRGEEDEASKSMHPSATTPAVQTTEETARIRKEAEHWFAKLGDPDFGVREKAMQELLARGESAQPLVESGVNSPDPEVKWRSAKLLICLKWKIAPDLHERLAGLLDDYDAQDWQERQRRSQELGIVGKERAIPTLMEIIKRDPSPSVKQMAVAALYHLGDVGIAALMDQGIKLEGLEPYQADIFISLGNRYLSEQEFEKAEREYLKALKMDPRNSVAAYNMACVYSLKKDLDMAVHWLEKSVEYGFDDFKWMREDPDLNNLHEDTRYQEILRRRRPSRDGEREGDGEI
ncbi:MAG: tetratricopeptide repeat protein [Planctomycetes bacterium]|nr:tetratricopeptide repeat protein [Planctomycetota bacterium]